MAVVEGDIVRATINWNFPDATTAQNVFLYEAGSGFNEQDFQVGLNIAARHNLALVELADIIDDDITMGDVEVSLSTDGGATFFDLIDTALATSPFIDTSDMLPHVCSAKVFFGGIGTGHEGRKSIGGIAEDWVTDSTILAAAVTDLVNYALVANDNISFTSGSLLYGWLRKPSNTFIFHDGSITVNTLIGTEARRKPGRGS